MYRRHNSQYLKKIKSPPGATRGLNQFEMVWFLTSYYSHFIQQPFSIAEFLDNK